jgi:hypothetical protein
MPPDEISKWTRNCLDTLRLMDLYGENGVRLRNNIVTEMANDGESHGQPQSARPIKRFLRYLKDLDEYWLQDHPEDAAPRYAKKRDKKPQISYETSVF